MWLARLECDAQRLAGAEQMMLTDYVVKRMWPKSFGERD
jgi:hypothetical protein